MTKAKEMTHIWVKQLRSVIGRPEHQRQVVLGLGLKGVGQEKLLNDSEAIRGMIQKVQHLISVEVRNGEKP